jgi:superfamily I DNA/RNA helicase
LEQKGERGTGRTAGKQDKLEVLIEVSRGCLDNYSLLQKIDSLFANSKDVRGAVRLSTIHRAKGLEAESVWILRGDLMPHPMAKVAWEKEQEDNLIYVAVTRTKDRLLFIDGMPDWARA